ncbi:class F sortase [Streptomyces sp. NPDC126514]|uniref:class F sortase n=1 Tax=Streptomyces sp. NPDC126514 TaxID=3155210 RepID=UPI003330BA46
MGTPLSRLGLVAALWGALTVCAVAAVIAVASWPHGDGGGDFGRLSSASDSAVPSPGPAQAGRAANGGATTGAPESKNASVDPARLSLPRLGVRAPVDPVAVASDGQVVVPKDPRRVGWYKYSPPPGSPQGSTVLVGHVDSDGRGLGVLVALNEVRQGERVIIERADGTRVTYQVTARRTVDKEALPGSGVFHRDGPAVLTLITCAGPYLPDQGGYQNNLVVTAVERPK